MEELTAAKIYTETKGQLTTKAAFSNYCTVARLKAKKQQNIVPTRKVIEH